MRRQLHKEMISAISADVEACAAHAEAMHTMDILAFIDIQKIPIEYLATPYRLVPSPGGEQLYLLLCEELRRRGKIGIANVEIHSRPQLAVLVPQEQSLMLCTLLWAGEPDRWEESFEDLLETDMELGGYALKDTKATDFVLEEPDCPVDDEDCLEECYLGSAMRLPRHPRDGHAIRGTRSPSRRMPATRTRKARGR